MKKFLINFYILIEDLANLIQVGLPIKKKILLFLIYLKISFKYYFLDYFFNFKTENFLGYNVRSFKYSTIHSLYQAIFLKNEYFFISNQKKPIIYDCGANIGFATLYLKWLYPNSIIKSFEPDPESFKLLTENIKGNRLKNVEIFNIALSDKKGKLDFYIAKNIDGSLMMSSNEGRLGKDGKKIIVNAELLSKYIKNERIDFLKIDVEGAENKIIDNLLKNNLLKNIENYIIEYHHLIGNDLSRLGKFLVNFEKEKFDYQINSRTIPLFNKNRVKDIMIFIYKK